MNNIFLAVACAAVVCAGTVRAEEPVSVLNGLELGTRILHLNLKADSQGRGTSIEGDWGGSYIGSLNYIDEEQDYLPNRLYAQYFLDDVLGVGISYDAVEAKTLERNRGGDPASDGSGDGYVGAQGVILYLVARYANTSAFTPFAEVGAGFYSSYFDENAGWSDGGRRYMDTEDAVAFVLAAGSDYAFTDNLSANLYIRLVDGLDVDVESRQRGIDHAVQPGSFPLDYFGLGLGLKYAFR